METNLSSIALRRGFKVSTFSCAILLSSTSLAADQELLEILRKNGVITPQQYDALSPKKGKKLESMTCSKSCRKMAPSPRTSTPP